MTSPTPSFAIGIATGAPAPTTAFAGPTERPVLTTVFTPPASCSTGFVQRGQIALNPMFPPMDIRQTSCYASEFIQYWTQGAFDELECPSGYQTRAFLPGAYIACCPDGFTLEPSDMISGSRPAKYISCYSSIPTSGLVVTYTQESGSFLTSTYTPTSSGELVYAQAYDGFAFGLVTMFDGRVVGVPTGTETTPTTPPNAKPSSDAITAGSSTLTDVTSTDSPSSATAASSFAAVSTNLSSAAAGGNKRSTIAFAVAAVMVFSMIVEAL